MDESSRAVISSDPAEKNCASEEQESESILLSGIFILFSKVKLFIEPEFIYSGTPADCSHRMNYQSLAVKTGIVQTLDCLYPGVQVSGTPRQIGTCTSLPKSYQASQSNLVPVLVPKAHLDLHSPCCFLIVTVNQKLGSSRD